MKTLKEVSDEITSLRSAGFKDMTPRQAGSTKARIEFLSIVKDYLISHPDEEYLKQKTKELYKKIGYLSGGFYDWVKMKIGDHKLLKKQYENEVELPKLKKQLKTMLFIISE